MVEIYQHQALWDNRQYPRAHQAFSEIWETEKLWVSFDRASVSYPTLKGWGLLPVPRDLLGYALLSLSEQGFRGC